jgi:hypothetical protein
MENNSNFLAPGSDGELDPGTGLWRKGLVYTRTGLPLLSTEQNHRISVGFKRGVGAAHPFRGFQEVYQRVATIANRRISQLTCPETGERPGRIILCHEWRWLGDKIVTALITVGLRCSDQGGMDVQGEPVPTEEALRSPGGATLEELARFAPQRADEIYNEFDFTDPSTPNTDLVTLSYGEPISDGDTVDFRPFVERAERLARSYHALLQTLGEASSQPLRIKRREWFLASQTFVTIHICFDRWGASDC